MSAHRRAVAALKRPAQYRKALHAGFWATVTGLGTAMLDGALTPGEGLAAVGLGLVAAGGVAASPKNAPAP